MDPPIAATPATASTKPSQSRSLHSKRSFLSKHPMHSNVAHGRSVDSPAYDASEEDNDPLTDSSASAVSVHASSAHSANNSRSRSATAKSNAATSARRHALASSLVESDEGVDSPTYDGDIESSTTAGPETPYTSSLGNRREHYASSVASTLSPTSPTGPSFASGSAHAPKSTPSPPALHRPTPSHPSRPTEPSPASNSFLSNPLSFDPAKLSPQDIESWFRQVRRCSARNRTPD